MYFATKIFSYVSENENTTTYNNMYFFFFIFLQPALHIVLLSGNCTPSDNWILCLRCTCFIWNNPFFFLFFYFGITTYSLFLSLRSICIKVSSSDNGKMCRLKTVVLRGSTFQWTGEAVTHVEVSRTHIGR